MFWFLGRSRMYTIMPGAEGISFADYRGQPEILEQAQQIVTLLRGVAAFEGSGGEPLNGLLLEGPPGTGKTWLAQAISTEAGVPFYYVDTSSLQAMFMGMGAIKVSRMYGKARKAAKEYGAAVIFLDEIDAIGSRSGVSRSAAARISAVVFGGGGRRHGPAQHHADRDERLQPGTWLARPAAHLRSTRPSCAATRPSRRSAC